MKVNHAPQGINLNDNQQPAVLGSVTTTWLVLLLTFGARLVCRRIMRMSLKIDDWLIIPAVVFATMESLVIIAYMVPNNLGKHIYIIPTEDRESRLLSLRLGIFIFQQTWALGILSAKSSILALYWRLFSQNKFVRYQIIFWGIIISCWGIEYITIKLAYCHPIRGLWDDSIKLSCTVDTAQVIFINGVLNTITDAALLFIPLPAIWSLGLGRKQKIGLTVIFFVGFLCTGASITRLVYMKKDFHLTTTIEDVSWNLTWTTTWTALGGRTVPVL